MGWALTCKLKSTECSKWLLQAANCAVAITWQVVHGLHCPQCDSAKKACYTAAMFMVCCYSALQVSCLAGVVNEQLSMSLYKLIAFVLCTITELSHCLFTLSSGQLSCKALYVYGVLLGVAV